MKELTMNSDSVMQLLKKRVVVELAGLRNANLSAFVCLIHCRSTEESKEKTLKKTPKKQNSEQHLIGSHRLFRSFISPTYMLALFTHNCVGKLADKDTVNKVHLHTFFPEC